MIQLIRTLTQTLADARLHEITLYRSDSYLYLTSLTSERETGLWTGETGLVYKPDAGALLKQLTRRLATVKPMRPFTIEAPVTFGAHTERDGQSGQVVKTLCTDYESVTLHFVGGKMLERFVVDLESSLAWAA
jgi:hypothetical protein